MLGIVNGLSVIGYQLSVIRLVTLGLIQIDDQALPA